VARECDGAKKSYGGKKFVVIKLRGKKGERINKKLMDNSYPRKKRRKTKMRGNL
jgi:hypothetical protein